MPLNWIESLSLFRVEAGLTLIAVLTLLADMFLPKTVDRGRVLGRAALVGLVGLVICLATGWGKFGSAFQGSFVHDGLAYFFKLGFLITGIFVLHMAYQYRNQIKRGRAELVLLILFALIGMSFLASSREFLLFFVALETLSISLYIITAYLRDEARSIEAGMKYLILGALSTSFLIFGISFLYGATGTTYFEAMARSVIDAGAVPIEYQFGAALVLIAMFFKITVFPFQIWAPDVYEGSPAPITAFLATGSKMAGFAALITLLLTVFAPMYDIFLPLFTILAAATILYGNLGAIRQTNIKRMLAYSSISHAGYLLVGLAALNSAGIESVLVYLAGYLFSTVAAFLVVVWVADQLRSAQIEDYAGLGKRSPVSAAAMLVALSSLAGVPPMAGFFGKYFVLSAAVKEGLLWLAMLGLLNVVVSLFYYLGVVKYMYARNPKEGSPLTVSLTQRIALYAAMAAIVILGIYPTPAITLAEAALRAF